MASKRPRAAYEDDHHHHQRSQHRGAQASFAVYGTPLPPADPDVRDDGSYVPVWKQEVRDERGRKRFHGAFTGGFSAGYFNTVGSKEGWAPSTFVSSRANRRKDAPSATQQRPEDFMDDEDRADAAEAEKIQMAGGFAGFGSTDSDPPRRGLLMDLLRTEGETMGVKLMKKMGWREGQGVGPRIRRAARLDMAGSAGDGTTHLFAPDNAPMIKFVLKNDHKGLGYEGESRLSAPASDHALREEDDEDDTGFGLPLKKPAKEKKVKGGFGIGVLNDTGSDDEDPYELGPKISYNRTIGEKKKKKKPALAPTNPMLKNRPVFISKKAAAATDAARRCHDGRLPLEGFVLSSGPSIVAAIITPDARYLPPPVPTGWVSKKKATSSVPRPTYTSTADAAKASTLDPKARASILGEAQLPGKSVFDYLSPAARDRLVAATGKTNLPAALGEIPKGYALTEEEQQRELWNMIPKIDHDIAVAALGRGASGWVPYVEDEEKRNRYRAYLETQAGIRDGLPERAANVTKDDWLVELNEFAKCAKLFKPMTGMMASRFTSSSSAPRLASDAPDSAASGNSSLLSKPAPKVEDPAETAAKMGMFGAMTRTTKDFYPTRLLCKRFNVKPPAHVQLDPERMAEDGGGIVSHDGQQQRDLDLVSKSAIDDMLKESGGWNQHWDRGLRGTSSTTGPPANEPRKEVAIDAERNEALEGQRAGDAVFKAIFGDSDGEDDV